MVCRGSVSLNRRKRSGMVMHVSRRMIDLSLVLLGPLVRSGAKNEPRAAARRSRCALLRTRTQAA